jgi:hypothetical protein
MKFYSLAKAIYLTAKWNVRDRQNHRKSSFAEFHGAGFFYLVHPV